MISTCACPRRLAAASWYASRKTNSKKRSKRRERETKSEKQTTDEAAKPKQVDFELGIPRFEFHSSARLRPPRDTLKTSDLMSSQQNRDDMARAEQHIDV